MYGEEEKKTTASLRTEAVAPPRKYCQKVTFLRVLSEQKVTFSEGETTKQAEFTK
jgi:hypothetical protein